jgi:tetraacyldisaccharide 4'-kinase
MLKALLLNLLKYATLPLALLYGLVIALRNWIYNKGISSPLKFSLPIINIGNLSVGGTGKTPHTEYLIEMLQDTYNVATLSRGYKRYTRGFKQADYHSTSRDIGDEPMQYHIKYPNVQVCVGEDRILAIPQMLQAKQSTQVILLDDAFQHRSIQPSLNILITDFAKPYYADYILPFGRLREFRSGAKRADIIIVSKCPAQLSQVDMQKMQNALKPLHKQQVYFTTIQYLPILQQPAASPLSLQQSNVLLVSGIANNAPMVGYVKAQAASVHCLTFADHYYYNLDDISDIIETYNNLPQGNRVLLTTEKDYTRLSLHLLLLQQANVIVAVLPIKVQFLQQQELAFQQHILQHLLQYYPVMDQDYLHYEIIKENNNQKN